MRFGAELTRLELRCEDALGRHEISVGFKPGEPKRLRADGAPVENLTGVEARPLVAVFLPDRLELVLGAPSLRRAHLDQVVAALWPSRTGTRRAYSAALAQRNALLSSIRAGRATRASLPAWDAELARHGIALMADRAATVERLRPRFAEHADGLGLEGKVELLYKPRATRGAGGRARRAPRLRPRARLHRPRAAPRRPRLQARRPRAALLRLARPAAPRAARAAAGRARGTGRRARERAAAAARRRDVRARRHPPRAPDDAAAPRRPVRDHHHRARARPGRGRGRRGADRDRGRRRPAGVGDDSARGLASLGGLARRLVPPRGEDEAA